MLFEFEIVILKQGGGFVFYSFGFDFGLLQDEVGIGVEDFPSKKVGEYAYYYPNAYGACSYVSYHGVLF